MQRGGTDGVFLGIERWRLWDVDVVDVVDYDHDLIMARMLVGCFDVVDFVELFGRGIHIWSEGSAVEEWHVRMLL